MRQYCPIEQLELSGYRSFDPKKNDSKQNNIFYLTISPIVSYNSFIPLPSDVEIITISFSLKTPNSDESFNSSKENQLIIDPTLDSKVKDSMEPLTDVTIDYRVNINSLLPMIFHNKNRNFPIKSGLKEDQNEPENSPGDQLLFQFKLNPGLNQIEIFFIDLDTVSTSTSLPQTIQANTSIFLAYTLIFSK